MFLASEAGKTNLLSSLEYKQSWRQRYEAPEVSRNGKIVNINNRHGSKARETG